MPRSNIFFSTLTSLFKNNAHGPTKLILGPVGRKLLCEKITVSRARALCRQKLQLLLTCCLLNQRWGERGRHGKRTQQGSTGKWGDTRSGGQVTGSLTWAPDGSTFKKLSHSRLPCPPSWTCGQEPKQVWGPGSLSKCTAHSLENSHFTDSH